MANLRLARALGRDSEAGHSTRVCVRMPLSAGHCAEVLWTRLIGPGVTVAAQDFIPGAKPLCYLHYPLVLGFAAHVASFWLHRAQVMCTAINTTSTAELPVGHESPAGGASRSAPAAGPGGRRPGQRRAATVSAAPGPRVSGRVGHMRAAGATPGPSSRPRPPRSPTSASPAGPGATPRTKAHGAQGPPGGSESYGDAHRRQVPCRHTRKPLAVPVHLPDH